MRVYDTSNEVYLDENLNEYTMDNAIQVTEPTVETWSQSSGDNIRRYWKLFDSLVAYLTTENLLDNVAVLNWISPYSETASKASAVGSDLTSVNDTNWSKSGVSGNGSDSYFTVGNISTHITDINNCAVVIASSTDNDSGREFGCSDGTNNVYVEINNTGTMEVGLGTASINTSIASGNGVFGFRSALGTLYAHAYGVEVGTSTAVAGSLPDRVTYLGAYNNDNTAESFSTKEICFLLIYDGRLSDEQMTTIMGKVEIIQQQFNRSRFN